MSDPVHYLHALYAGGYDGGVRNKSYVITEAGSAGDGAYGQIRISVNDMAQPHEDRCAGRKSPP